MSLSVVERKAIAEAWVASGKTHGVTIINHIGANSITDVKELAAHAAASGCAAICAMPPFFFKPPTARVLALWLKEVGAAAPGLPLYYYYFPDITGVTIDPHALLLAVEEVGVPSAWLQRRVGRSAARPPHAAPSPCSPSLPRLQVHALQPVAVRELRAARRRPLRLRVRPRRGHARGAGDGRRGCVGGQAALRIRGATPPPRACSVHRQRLLLLCGRVPPPARVLLGGRPRDGADGAGPLLHRRRHDEQPQVSGGGGQACSVVGGVAEAVAGSLDQVP